MNRFLKIWIVTAVILVGGLVVLRLSARIDVEGVVTLLILVLGFVMSILIGIPNHIRKILFDAHARKVNRKQQLNELVATESSLTSKREMVNQRWHNISNTRAQESLRLNEKQMEEVEIVMADHRSTIRTIESVFDEVEHDALAKLAVSYYLGKLESNLKC